MRSPPHPPARDHAPPTVAESLVGAVARLRGRTASPRLDAELLLAKVLGVSRAGLIVRGTDVLTAAALSRLESLVERRAAGAPAAYLTGSREFWSLSFDVTPDVLVPRPETELLVELALALIPRDEPRRVLDLGTGSGAIALALASERPRARVTGSDLSPAALAVAQGNACKLGIHAEWRLGAWYEAVPGERFDMIAANPPYIADGDPALRQLAAEPALALIGGPTGLEALRAIIAAAPSHLCPGGWLLLEHGRAQAAAVARLMTNRGFDAVRSHDDFFGQPRVTLGILRTSNQGLL